MIVVVRRNTYPHCEHQRPEESMWFSGWQWFRGHLFSWKG